MLKRFALMIVAAALLGAFGCSELDPVSPGDDPIKADEGFGNCLSVPVIWADGFDLALRGTYGSPVFDGESAIGSDGVTTGWLQQDPLNAWQAGSMMGAAEGTAVDWIDWGDNLESKAWPANAKVRVEVVLFEDLLTPMTTFEMTHISGLGADEMWGATQTQFDGNQATVYSHCARLTIQKLEEHPQDLTWNATLGQWEGDISEPFYNSAVFDSGDSPITKYSAEINVKGKVIYGMLWDVAANGDGMGTYRITFSLDPNGPVALNTVFDAFTQIMQPAEEEVTGYSPDKAEPTGGVVTIDVANNLTYIDQPITRAKGGGGGGGGNPDKPGGGGGEGGGGGKGPGGPR